MTVLEKLCEEAIGLLKADARTRQMPKRGGTHTSFDSKGGARTFMKVYDDHRQLIDRNLDTFQQLPGWSKAMDAHAIATKKLNPRATGDGDLAGLIIDVVNRFGLNPTRRQIQTVADLHIGMWETGRLCAVRECAIVGLLPGVKKCALGPGVTMRQLTTRSLTTFWNEDAALFSLYGQGHAWARILSAKYLLTVESSLEREVTSEMFTASLAKAELALGALRLAMAGGIGAVATRERFIPKPSFISGSSIQDPPASLAVWAAAPEVRFDSPAARSAGALYRRLARGVPAGFEMALRRFSQSFERRSDEDAIVDLTVALEATLLHGQNAELTYRIQVLGAALLGQGGAESARKLKELYAVRSKVVHGAAMLSKIIKETTPGEFLREMRALVGTILCKYLARIALGMSMDDVARALEQHAMVKLTR